MTTENKGLDLSVIVPAYNEEGRLAHTLERVVAFLTAAGYAFEVIVVDDGSADRTSEVAETCLQGVPHTVVRNEPNRGKGYSVRRGMLLGQGRYLLFTDADLATPIEEIVPLQAALDAGYDIAIASRGLAQSRIEVHESWIRETLGKTFNLFVRTCVMGGIRDTQCGFKLFKRAVVKPIFERQTVDRWGFDVELLLIARKLGYSIAEIPVRWTHSFDSRIRTGLDGIGMVLDALRIKWRHRKLRPPSPAESGERE
jgi:dolichyl-phosphate beta-glucosyltransferase